MGVGSAVLSVTLFVEGVLFAIAFGLVLMGGLLVLLGLECVLLVFYYWGKLGGLRSFETELLGSLVLLESVLLGLLRSVMFGTFVLA